MGTGGRRPNPTQSIVDCLNDALRIVDIEFGLDDGEKLRNSETPGLYYFRHGDQEFEVVIRPRQK